MTDLEQFCAACDLLGVYWRRTVYFAGEVEVFFRGEEEGGQVFFDSQGQVKGFRRTHQERA